MAKKKKRVLTFEESRRTFNSGFRGFRNEMVISQGWMRDMYVAIAIMPPDSDDTLARQRMLCGKQDVEKYKKAFGIK